ncbi:Thermophilic serine proteinase precursor [Phycisphaerae bacterium RAS1]|nr:Thermophilic serine proteinase precursor [Phycisphaerae bacterium RAS1]
MDRVRNSMTLRATPDRPELRPFVARAVALLLVFSATGRALADEPRLLIRLSKAEGKRQLASAGALGRPLPGGWHAIEKLPLDDDGVMSGQFAAGVEAIETDFVRRAADEFPAVPATPMEGQSLRDRQYALSKVRAAEAWELQRGRRGVVVAVIDSGVDLEHPSLAGNLWTNARETLNGYDDDNNGYVDDVHGWDFVGQDADPSDVSGHGTHVAGIIAAGQDGPVAGLANVSVMVLRVLDSRNEGFDSRTMAAIGYAIDEGADIINLSLGGPDDSSALRDACNAAQAAGVVVVAAAGNQAGRVLYPAAYESAIAVGASDEADRVPSFSNAGRSLDLAAPGVNIISTALGGGFEYRSGTSVATPLVSAAAALLRSADARLSASDVRTRLTLAADDIEQAGWDEASGYGRLNVFTALNVQSADSEGDVDLNGKSTEDGGVGGGPVQTSSDDDLPPWIHVSSQASRTAARDDDYSTEAEVFGATAPLVPAPCGAGLSAGMLGAATLSLACGCRTCVVRGRRRPAAWRGGY